MAWRPGPNLPAPNLENTMLPAIQVADDHARVRDEATLAAIRTECRYQLPGAIPDVWKRPDWQVVEQAFDLPDVYVSYIEVRTYAASTCIPIQCPRYDLYWLYLVRGAMDITTPDTRKALVTTTEKHYRVSYLPAGRYACSFGEGTHHIFYVVHKPKALFREESPELGMEATVISAVKTRLAVHAASYELSMQDGSAASILRFLRAPGNTYLRRSQSIMHLSLELVFIAHQTLLGHAEGKAIGAEWAEQLKAYINRCILEGTPITADSVAEQFRISAVYARRLFKTHHGETIGSYITRQKLELAVQLLQEGDPPVRVARYLGWTPAHFSRAYRAKFGHPPSQRHL
ncbi:helix-turn-helix transcriptional regulator [Parapedobacter indicus]|nr:helix-turn-helix transcriptional regulator [Parapedobacter indicus]